MTREISIVICSHDRSDDVAECVSALLEQDRERTAQITVVDSASSSRHAQRLQQLADQQPRITLCRRERPGLSLARNAGIALSRGAWIAFLDDDAVPAPDWLERAHTIACTARPEVAVVGGRIVPRWPGARPPHVGARWLMFLSCIEADAQPHEQRRPQCYGANLMCRSATLRALGGFAEELGRVGSKLLSGEETLLLAAVEERGERVRYDGALRVEHKIGAERLTRAWIRERAYWGGVTEVLIASKLGLPRPRHLQPLKVAASIPLLRALAALRDPHCDRSIRRWYAQGALAALMHPDRFVAASSGPVRASESELSGPRFLD